MIQQTDENYPPKTGFETITQNEIDNLADIKQRDWALVELRKEYDSDKDALIRKLNEERHALMERVNELVQRDGECAKAYNAGAAAMFRVLTRNSTSYMPFSEWKEKRNEI